MAQAGDLVVISGGDEADFEGLPTLFQWFFPCRLSPGASRVWRSDEASYQSDLAGNRLALAEGLIMAEKIGLETGHLLDVLQDSACASKTMADKGPKMINADYSKTRSGSVEP